MMTYVAVLTTLLLSRGGLNPDDEGSYGRNSSNVERPVGDFVCVGNQALSVCP